MTDGPRGEGLSGDFALADLLAVVLFIAWRPHSQGHDGLTVVIITVLATAALRVVLRPLHADRLSRAGRPRHDSDDVSQPVAPCASLQDPSRPSLSIEGSGTGRKRAGPGSQQRTGAAGLFTPPTPSVLFAHPKSCCRSTGTRRGSR